MAESDPGKGLPSQARDLLAVAHVSRPHGVRGELSVIVLAPPVLDADELIVDRRLFLRSSKGEVRPVQCLDARPHQDRWLVTLEGIDSREEADALRGFDLCLPREELPGLPEGWFWETDLSACRVIDKTLGEIGEFVSLDTRLPQPQLVLRKSDGAIVNIPWVRPFVIEVDPEASLIHTDLPPGFPGLSDED